MTENNLDETSSDEIEVFIPVHPKTGARLTGMVVSAYVLTEITHVTGVMGEYAPGELQIEDIFNSNRKPPKMGQLGELVELWDYNSGADEAYLFITQSGDTCGDRDVTWMRKAEYELYKSTRTLQQ